MGNLDGWGFRKRKEDPLEATLLDPGVGLVITSKDPLVVAGACRPRVGFSWYTVPFFKKSYIFCLVRRINKGGGKCLEDEALKITTHSQNREMFLSQYKVSVHLTDCTAAGEGAWVWEGACTHPL